MQQSHHRSVALMQVFAGTVDDERAIRHRRFNHDHGLIAQQTIAHADLHRFRSYGEEIQRLVRDLEALVLRQTRRQFLGQAPEQPFREHLDFTRAGPFKGLSRRLLQARITHASRPQLYARRQKKDFAARLAHFHLCPEERRLRKEAEFYTGYRTPLMLLAPCSSFFTICSGAVSGKTPIRAWTPL